MKKFVRITILFIIITLLVTQTDVLANIFGPKSAYAVGDLQVNWGVPEGAPIFTLSNIAPGRSESRTVTVKNNATSARPAGIRGIITSDTGSLSDVLNIKIAKGATDIYGGTTGNKTLAQFMHDTTLPNFVSLTTLTPGETATYMITVTFQESAGNEFQNSSIVFDLKIGYDIPTPTACSSTTFTNIIYGTQRTDVLNGTSGNDLIFALEGNDAVDGKGGDDCIIGGVGNDSLITGAGNDKAFGEAGNDALQGAAGDDVLDGGNGTDSLLGGAGNDVLTGGNGIDSAVGGAGTDACTAEARVSCEL